MVDQPGLPGPDSLAFTEDLGESDPRQVGSFEIVARFRSSSATRVFAAKALETGRWVAIKWVSRSRTDFESMSRVVVDEAQALSVLRHPNIVGLVASGEDRGGAWLAIELVPGLDLRRIANMLRVGGDRLPRELALYIVLEILSALNHVHQARGPNGEALDMVHRDVDPSNILVSRRGRISLTDFGMVWMRGRAQRPTLPGFVKGKFRYLAPEYIAGGTVSPLVDIYAVGVTLYEISIGGPWAARDEMSPSFMKRIVQEGLPFARLLEAGIDPDLVEIVACAAHRDPDARFPSAASMSRAVELWLDRRGASPRPETLEAFLAARREP